MSAIEDARPPVLQPCPSCGLADQVAGVPAVYHAGRDSIRVTTPARSGEREQTVTRSVTNSLSWELSPVPKALVEPSQGILGAGVFLSAVSVVTFIWGAAAGHWFSDDLTVSRSGSSFYGSWPGTPEPRPDFAFLGWISALALVAAITLLFRAGVLRSDRQRLLAGRPNAERLWSRGWYCRRCGSVHFRTETGQPAQALTLQEFRAMVWEAGGYGSYAHRLPSP